MRLVPVKGVWHDIEFSVKPTTFEAHDIAEELDKMLKEWHKETAENFDSEYEQFLEENKENIDSSDPKVLSKLAEQMPRFKIWQMDKEFRSSYIKRKAEASMEFKSKVPEELWSDPKLEYGTVQEAWDFFIGKLSVPPDGIMSA